MYDKHLLSLVHFVFSHLLDSFLIHAIVLQSLKALKLGSNFLWSVFSHLRLFFDVSGSPCGHWLWESPPVFWRWNGRHHTHSASDREGQMGTCHTCDTAEQHTPGIRYTQTPTVHRVESLFFRLVLERVPFDCVFTWKLAVSKKKRKKNNALWSDS